MGAAKGLKVMRTNHGDEYIIKELNPVKWTFDNIPQILVPIANGTEEMEAIMIIDILRRAKANVVVASVEDKLEILASRKVKLEADMLLDEAAKLSYDLIVLPGGLGGAQKFAVSEKLVDTLKKQRESNRPYGAICASPALVLEPHGLLKIFVYHIGSDVFLTGKSLAAESDRAYQGGPLEQTFYQEAYLSSEEGVADASGAGFHLPNHMLAGWTGLL
ncbi:hypothetical protein GH714_039651 [Hevea brasiliensis]|uniref:DJ-1/PfpI domain-containing protein n=1 Tax=Hevea brasiliensis TaxID=3981 RepID=A0A6A6KEP7_HEVBR|nr:hypothetical protein GH714_039651 [Hevea brasiliensis]